MQTPAGTADCLVFSHPVLLLFLFFSCYFLRQKSWLLPVWLNGNANPGSKTVPRRFFLFFLALSLSHFDRLAKRAAGGLHRRLVGVQRALDWNCLFSRRNQPNAEIMSGNESHRAARLRRRPRCVFVKWGAAWRARVRAAAILRSGDGGSAVLISVTFKETPAKANLYRSVHVEMTTSRTVMRSLDPEFTLNVFY